MHRPAARTALGGVLAGGCAGILRGESMEYSYLKFFQKAYQWKKQEFAFRAESVNEALKWKSGLRAALWRCLGLDVLEEISGEMTEEDRGAVLLETVREDGYCRHKYVMQTLPEVFMPFYVLVPDGADEKHPAGAMLTIPAHNANKNTVCGVAATPEEEKKLADTPLECYGKEFVKQGYVVFCPDLPGFGERIEPVTGKKSSLGCSCQDLSEIAEALGFSMAALEVWDLMWLLDFACAFEAVAWEQGGARIGCAGFSGGGLCAMWLAALDDRIQLAVISGYVHGYYDSMLLCHRCACNFVPKLWRLCDISDICSLIAPRPLFMENGTEDRQNGCFGIEGPKRQAEKIRRAYALYGAEEKLVHVTPEGMHRWYGECYEFVNAWHPAAAAVNTDEHSAAAAAHTGKNSAADTGGSGHGQNAPEEGAKEDDIDAIVGLLDQMTLGGDSRMKVNVVQNAQPGKAQRVYHHGRCDVGSPWAKGQAFDVLE